MTNAPMMTQYSADEVVPKWDPRIARRGVLDTLMAEAVLLDYELDPRDGWEKYDLLAAAVHKFYIFLGLCRDVDAGVEPCPQDRYIKPLEELHVRSHELAFRHFGKTPEDKIAARLNVFRTRIRQAELLFCYEGATAADQWIQYVLNRLSSVAYVAMWDFRDEADAE